jgi:hypothetical protein
MSGVTLRVALVLKLDSFDVSHAFCQRALGDFRQVWCAYGSLWRPKCLCLCFPRCRLAGVSQYRIILQTACWTTCSASSQSGLSGNIGAL